MLQGLLLIREMLGRPELLRQSMHFLMGWFTNRCAPAFGLGRLAQVVETLLAFGELGRNPS